MPKLSTTIHVDMLNQFARIDNSLAVRVFRAIRREVASRPIYGLQWGDPETFDPLRFIRDRYVLPYVKPEHTAVEIGPGGGRWTQYLLNFKKLYAVDYHPELLRELRKNFGRRSNIEFVKNQGADFPTIPANSVDYLLSLGVFVHLDLDIIQEYIRNMRTIVKPGGNIVLNYSDQHKIMAQINPGFSNNTPEKMREVVQVAGFRILEEDLTTFWHSAVIRFTKLE